jgi:hypothetical protein
MKSEEKFDIEIVPMPEYGNKLWLKIKFKNGQEHCWVPSFEDVARIIKGLAYCEDVKYPNRGQYGRWLLGNLLHDCLKGIPWEEIRQRYKIPKR